MIDIVENLILINERIRTAEIERCWYSDHTNRYNVIFQGSPKVYSYDHDKVLWLRNPVKLNPEIYQLIYQGRKLINIEAISILSDDVQTYWHIRFRTGKECVYREKELLIIKSCLEDVDSKNIFEYLKQVAAENAISADDGTKLLSRQYNNIDFIAEDKAIAAYLNPRKYKCQKYSVDTLIFPFGCNVSQQRAVRAAFENQISVVQGPPGTGKTQTILNIIANIIKLGKTVLVVSNNNFAVSNVLEKLSGYDMGFIVASLGNFENKQKFIETQKWDKEYPSNIISWKDADAEKVEFLREIHGRTEELNTIFFKQEYLATLRQEIQALDIEWQHYKQEIGDIKSDVKSRRYLNSTRLIQLWNECLCLMEDGHFSKFTRITNSIRMFKWFIFRIKSKMCGISGNGFYEQDLSVIISEFHALFYKIRHTELYSEIKKLEEFLATRNTEHLTHRLSDMSMKYLKNVLYRKYGNNHVKSIFSSEELRNNWKKVLEEYPVVLSTTFSSRCSLSQAAVFDYLIMDEASQVSVETGALALSCARNAIIVGDTMQLPNVVTKEDEYKLGTIARDFCIPEGYNCADNSFLQSICKIIPDVPQTLLREHYRCHPKIINFCNQKFYGGNLVIMTRDRGEDDVICAIRTVEGNHSRDHINQREIDVIKNEVLPVLPYGATDIGVIAPYNSQVKAVSDNLGQDIEVATVHKFQGREKDAIILTTVDDIISPFSDNSNLLNVAISRAKQKFCLVVSGNTQPKDSNISDLISYIEYNNCTVTSSKIHSIFDYLYKQYTDIRVAYLKRRKRISKYDSENLTYALIEDILHGNIYMQHLDVICHQSLNMLIRDFSLLDEEERKYAINNRTHIDFLIYNRVSKQPVLAIETDGYTYHKSGTTQAERDIKKDHILELYGIPLVRLSTTGSNEKKIIEDKLAEILHLS